MRGMTMASCGWVVAFAMAGTGMCEVGDEGCAAGWEAGLATWAGIGDEWLREAIVWDDGHGASIYIKGEFAQIGGRVFNHVARWDGQAWQPLVGVDGIGLGGEEADAGMLRGAKFAVFDDGSGEALYVAGRMALGGGEADYGVARWDGQAWSMVGGGAGVFDATVESLEVFDDGNGAALYAGGAFGAVGGTATGIVARWDGEAWSALPASVGGTPTSGIALVLRRLTDAQGAALYVGGMFQSAGGVSARSIVRWDGQAWTALVDQQTGFDGFGSFVRTIEVFDAGDGPAVYVAGDLFSVDFGPPLVVGSRVWRWDGALWTEFASMLTGQSTRMWNLFVREDGSAPALFAGGRFGEADGRVLNSAAQLVDGAWVGLGGADGVGVRNNYDRSSTLVRQFLVHDDGDGADLHLFGAFDEAGGRFADNIARWDGTEWYALAPMGPGDVSGLISAMVVFDDGSGPSLYAGGSLIAAGNRVTTSVARWDGAEWHPLVGSNGQGLELRHRQSRMGLLRFDDGDGEALYFGGSFDRAGDVEVGNIVRWDGSAWSAVGSAGSIGTDWPIHAIAAFDDGDGAAIYAVGDSELLKEGLPRFARWLPGNAWEALANPQDDGLVYEAALAHDDGSGAGLFVGGSRDGQAWLGRWRDGGWETIEDVGGFFDGDGAGLGTILTLEFHDDGSGEALYVGGSFDGASASVARWDGATFTPVGGGFTGDDGQPAVVRELRRFDDGNGAVLVASGTFRCADGRTATRIARWDGVSWQPLESPDGEGLVVTDDSVRVALAGFDDGNGAALHAGGPVVEAGGNVSVGFAKWRPCAVIVPGCLGDLDGDGAVDTLDLGVVLGAFGASAAGDVNGDGVTDAADLGIVLGAFGSGCE